MGSGLTRAAQAAAEEEGEMVERLCRAVQAKMLDGGLWAVPGEVEGIVCAVLKELREPTEAMIAAGLNDRDVSGMGSRGLPRCYARMIEAALSKAEAR